MIKGGPRLRGRTRGIGLLSVLTLVMGLLLPSSDVVAQETPDESATTVALAEVPSTGARRPGPVLLWGARVRVPVTEAESEPEPVPEGVAPVEFRVDSLGVAAPIELGGIVDGAMQDPSGPWVVSWYDALGKIGQGRNVVMAGHIDYYNSGPDGTPGPAIFYDIPHLAEGEVISLVDENGGEHQYAVAWTRMFDVATELTPEVIRNDIIADTGQETLTLITCGGDFDPSTGEYLQRWVVRATLI
jgi:hypothetical protein